MKRLIRIYKVFKVCLGRLDNWKQGIRMDRIRDRIKQGFINSLPLIRKGSVILGIIFMLILIPVIMRTFIIQLKLKENYLSPKQTQEIETVRKKLVKEVSALDKELARKVPGSYYLIINSASNEFTLMRGTRVIRKDKCSTGSYVLLKNGDKQQWMFSTPKGEFRIQGKITSPVWKKPDWAFVEEGLPVPPMDHHSRFEYGVLGDYALSLGDGYLIHGTLYQRFLGMPVTHGCVRLSDENLELVYNALSTGSKVYIY